ncbi:TusE/DsrC/DsvC family sulfur relay protein [Salinimonas chungwhensis]|uniref:TusE/DsrC/DsvC family sulfur relay protein n=1 Tax=Salinimonas chungwhensis TaxID=265425 RepID=UPI00037AF4C5|nr:TusE/DsrC/DsvC family sulfur relay protein [Salinimonas chungwhensis]
MKEQNTFDWKGQSVPVDKNGYLLNVSDWQEDMVPVLAAQEGIILSDAHWEVVKFVRHFYMEYDTSPAIRALVNAMKQTYGPDKGNSRYLQRLFPKGPAKQATKLAGLPKPAKCL